MIDYVQLKKRDKEIRRYNQERIREKREEYNKTHPDSEWGPNTQPQSKSISNSLQRSKEYKFLERLENAGYKIKLLTPYQFRIEDKVDIYPTSKKYHVLKTGERGNYYKLENFIRKKVSL